VTPPNLSFSNLHANHIMKGLNGQYKGKMNFNQRFPHIEEESKVSID